MNFLIRGTKKIVRKMLHNTPSITLTNDVLNKALNFYKTYPSFRSLDACSKCIGEDTQTCLEAKKYLYKTRKLGLYFFEESVPPQKYMRAHILKNFSTLNNNSLILEVGPGQYPLFPVKEYPNWYGTDKYLTGNTILFKDNNWRPNLYDKESHLFDKGFEDLTQIQYLQNLIGKFDLICASHSFEHVFEPIKSLKESNKMLKPGGIIALFVPDAFSDDINTKDPTHTLYLTREMILEFFEYAGNFRNIEIEQFRPNADIFISAIKN